ncbi:MAG: response regulator [candidate division Zixibacteria bacterium]|nr:response regulator [candidate division Zixibacteria bacterium]
MKKHLKIGLVEDNRFHAILFEQSVKEKYPQASLRFFSTGGEFLKSLKTEKYDIICLDFHLPDYTGLELLSLVRAEITDVPIIIITGAGSEQIAVEAMKSGATDYITKSTEYTQTIPRVIKQAYQRQRLILKNRRLEEKSVNAEKLKTITIMTSTLNHEINNPLMAIMGNVELLMDNPQLQDKSVKEKLSMISDLALRIQSITKQMANLTTASTTDTPVGPMLKLKRVLPSRIKKVEAVVVESADKSN